MSNAEKTPVARQKYPKNFDENLNHRHKVILKSSNNDELKAYLNSYSSDDILYWINTFVWTYNPRAKHPKTPFITYPFQDQFILSLKKHIEEQRDFLVDKSRDMGVSWCVLLVFTWFWIFKGAGYDFMCGSRKEQYVDKIGDMNTLMQKIRFILQNLPKWMLPPGFDMDKHATYMKIINPKSKNSITGEATNANFSRGGRQRAIFFDEFAFWDNDSPAWRSSADTTNCRIAVSTPHGFNNHFAKLRYSNSIDVESLHWTLHPEKAKDAYHTKSNQPLHLSEAFVAWKKDGQVTSPWYEAEVKRRNNDPVEVAQELDISYEGSAEGILFEWEKMEIGKQTDIQLSKERIVIACDPATEGDDEAVIYVSNNGMIIEKKILKKPGDTGLAAELVSFIYKHKAQVLIMDAIGNNILGLVKELLGGNASKYKLIAFKSSEKAENTFKYFNKRAEAYHEASMELRYGRLQMDDDYLLQKQLSATKYTKKNGRIILISKEEIKGVCGSSPDRADAWVLIPQGLKSTHSRMEVEYREKYRKTFYQEEVVGHHNYGDWQDYS